MGKKMQWLIDAYNKGVLGSTFKFRLIDGGKDYGTVCMPTGTGKSGVMIEDILNRVGQFRHGMLVVNLSCPTLRLSQQLVCDLFETMHGVFKDSFMEEVCLVLNSSDSQYNYSTGGCPVYSGDDMGEVLYNAAQHGMKVAVIASCHKSLQKFVRATDSAVAFGCDIVNYIDESHLVPYDAWCMADEGEKVDLLKLRQNSKALYLFSATPDNSMTMDLTDNPSDPYIYKMYPIDAINENIILPPRIRCIRSSSITDADIYIDLLQECKEFGGYRKMLITLRDTDSMRKLTYEFERRGYKVFGANAADGFTGGDHPIKDAVDFADVVDAWDGHCFVLQIKQLTQGTDIRTLTDCVMPVANDIKPKTYRNLIQTMGRVLRAAPGERGKSYAQRTKKAGNIFFLLTPDANPAKEACMRRFALRYYGLECALYGAEFRTPAEMTYEIESTKDKVKSRIVEMKDIIHLNLTLFGSNIEKEAMDVISYVDSQEYYGKYLPNIPEYHLLDNRQLLRYTVDTIKKIVVLIPY